MYIAGNISRNTIAMVLAGGKGERLSPITLHRSKPAVSEQIDGKEEMVPKAGRETASVLPVRYLAKATLQYSNLRCRT